MLSGTRPIRRRTRTSPVGSEAAHAPGSTETLSVGSHDPEMIQPHANEEMFLDEPEFDPTVYAQMLPHPNTQEEHNALERQIVSVARIRMEQDGQTQFEMVMERLARMIAGRFTQDTIAQEFGVTRQTIWRWRKKLEKLNKERGEGYDPVGLLGELDNDYKQAQGVIVREMAKHNPNMAKVACARNIHHIIQGRARLFDTFGVVNLAREKLTEKPGKSDEHKEQANEIMDFARNIMTGDFEAINATLVNE